jgi:hypothetical protein
LSVEQFGQLTADGAGVPSDSGDVDGPAAPGVGRGGGNGDGDAPGDDEPGDDEPGDDAGGDSGDGPPAWIGRPQTSQ